MPKKRAHSERKKFLFNYFFVLYMMPTTCIGYTLKRSLPFMIQSCFTMNALWPLTFSPERAESALCSIDPTFDSSRLTQEWVGKAGEWIEKEKVHATLKGVRCPLCAIIHTQAKCVHSRSCSPSWCLVHVKVKIFTFLTRLRGEVKVLNVTIMNSPLPQTMIPQKTCFYLLVYYKVDFGGTSSTEFWRKLLTTELTQ